MQYMLLVYGNDEAWNDMSTERKDALEAAHRDVLADLAASGELVLSNELSTTDARVVRRDEHRLLVSDGPFSESKEWVGGFYVIEVGEVQRAVEIACRLEETTFSAVEIRALMH
ncbi:YciI family protein [Agromyces larvae]|uniref:YciI family protein n=1 Tax=Agromyces larvae TaxID=2929802 RepID=A0ABY4C272_9MICO|nr:YciI family protein [Agromyces larvae]UOE45578.1 YciI family protein [Agromyces larvae]